MRISDAPYLGTVNHSLELRIAAVNLHNQFAVVPSSDKTVLRDFWLDQITRVDFTWGTPFNGTYTGHGRLDIRPQVYAVQTAVRMHGNAATKLALKAFCQFFADAASAIGVIPVASVSVAPATTSGVVGTTRQIVPTVLPSNATNKAVTYVSSAPLVATVSATGLITFVAAGTATVTTTTVDGGKTATTAVTVTAA